MKDGGKDAASVPGPGKGGTTWQQAPGRCPLSACPGGRLPPASEAGGGSGRGGLDGDVAAGPGGEGLHGAGGCTKEGRGPGAARQILSPQLGGDL